MNHYETLGIDPTASQDEIKAAFRRCASAAHPDKDGGNTERMAAVNRAYAVLSDPASREEYDRTGKDPAATLEDEAREMLRQIFQAVVEGPLVPTHLTVVDRAGELLAEHAKQLEQAKRDNSRESLRLYKLRDKVRVKGEKSNMVHQLIDHKLSQLFAQIDGIDRGLAVNAVARELWTDYEQDAEQGRQP